MRKSYLYAGLLPLSAACLLTGCVDDGYDVGDIDTTSRIEVKNLTLPLELDDIKIDKVIDLEDNENISVIDGAYAIEKTGEISTSTFKIDPIHVRLANAIQGSSISISNPGAGAVVAGEKSFPLPHIDLRNYDLGMKNIDKSLVSLKEVESKNPIEISIILTASRDLLMAADMLALENLRIKVPSGLIDPECGGVEFSGDELGFNHALEMDRNGRLVITVKAKGIKNHAPIIDRNLNITGEVGVMDGASLYVQTNGINALPSDIKLEVAYEIADFDLASFSGQVNYDMDVTNIQDIELSGLPDFLDSPDTEIYLANPTIDININNPVGGYNMAGTGRLSLISNFSGVGNTSEAEGAMVIEADPAVQKISFNTANMPGLSSILVNKNAGGLPKTISVAVKDLVFAGDVKDFPIGTDIEGAQGDYSFTAPLGFAPGSQIIYEKTEDGWYDDDLKGLNIRTINLTAVCTTDLPVGLNLKVYPLDRDGNIIPVDEESNFFTVTANSNAEPVMISIEAKGASTISGLDGIRFIATVSQNDNVHGSTEPLGPEQTIILKDLRIKVDGYYEKEF